MSNNLPTETSCGECFATVPLDARAWNVEHEGAHQLALCGGCGALVVGVVGSTDYIAAVMRGAEG